MCCFHKHSVPTCDLATDNKAFIILVKLIEPISYFLSAGLYSKIGLTESNRLFAWIAVLYDKIAGIA